MKTFQQARDVVDHTRDFHHQLSNFYEKLKGESERERVKMLLDYLSRHEKHLEETLAQYEDDVSEKILDAWFQYIPEEQDQDISPDKLHVESDMSVEDIIRMAMRLDDYLIKLYEGMVERANFPQVREAFLNILEMEKQEQHQVSKNVLSMTDI